VLFARAEAARFAADHDDREQFLDEASGAAHDDRERALVLVERGEWLRRGRRIEDARLCFEKAILLAGGVGDRETQALATARQASALVSLSRPREAADVLDALDASLEGVSVRTRAVVLDVRGYLAGNVGDLGAQQQAYERAAALYTQAGDARRAAGAESNLADAQNRMGRYARADEALRRALQHARKVGNRLTEGYALLNLGYASSFSGRTEEALETLARARALAESIGDAHLALGARIYAARARLAHADASLVEELRAIATEARGDVTLEANALGLASRALLLLGDVPGAAAAADRALAIRATRGSVEEGEGEIFFAAILAYEASGRIADAARVQSEARARLGELAARIADPDARASFLRDVPAHRALMP
jgi:tetratricopeptide (TPR) repeat protein